MTEDYVETVKNVLAELGVLSNISSMLGAP